MVFELSDIVALFTVVQLLFLAVVNFNYKKGKRLSSRILSGFMVSNAILVSQYLLTHYHIVSREQLTLMYSIENASYLLLMPFLYLYILSMCYSDFRLKKVHVLHFLPFIAIASFSFVAYSLGEASLLAIEFWGRRITIHLQIFCYLVASVIVLVSYRRNLRELFSSVEKIDLAWCNLILAAFTTMWSLDFLSWLLSSTQFIARSTQHWMFFTSLLINLSFTIAVTYRGLLQSQSFSGIQEYPKYLSSRLKPSECDEIIQKLTSYLKTAKPYLRPSLSVEDLTTELKVPAKNLSQAIHTGLNKNFYDLINAYRIEEVKRLMSDKRYDNQTFLALAFSSGFNSKSVFNAAFKKHTGITPKQFKSQQAASPAGVD